MRVIGVLDLRGGRAVHARGGARDAYAPVAQVAGGAALAPGDAVALARRYLDALDVRELYAADLDAIVGGVAQRALVAEIAALGAPLWLDAGVATVDAAREAVAIGASMVVAGLETLDSFDALARICEAVGGAHIAFSLDLRGGELLARPGVVRPGERAEAVAARAAAAGVGAIIVLDVARVGAAGGPDFELVARVRRATPDVALLAGGGARNLADLRALAAAGCDGALVATALHAGRITAAEVRAAAGLGTAAASSGLGSGQGESTVSRPER